MGNQLEGKNFVVSGIFEKYEREALKTLIEAHGGKIQAGVSAKTDYVVAGSNMGPSKLEKAKALGVQLIDEKTFEGLIA